MADGDSKLDIPVQKFEYLDHTADVQNYVSRKAETWTKDGQWVDVSCLQKRCQGPITLGVTFLRRNYVSRKAETWTKDGQWVDVSCLQKRCQGPITLGVTFLRRTGGDNLQEAFEQVVVAMFNYMTTDFSTVELSEEQETEAEGEDLQSLLFHFLDEWLFLFSAEPFFIARKVVITEFDLENFRIKSKGYGEPFDIAKHPQGTEVKAITYSNMQIYDDEDKHEVFVIIDI